ncbi:MAG TPA: SCP2 sterol-binding domain-containing protein [Steroidobacteraceae bacterium]|jgi:ubiquinone biosynthesis protein UbiJ|nr:SCP2 sterol-binding domain-containing protein [Steroidobacteraceae bacterium]
MSSVADIAIERLLGHAVARARSDSPRAVALMAELAGRKLRVQVLGTPLALRLECDGQALHLCPDQHTDAAIVGAPLSLLALAGEDPQAVITRGDVTIGGDAQIAQGFRELGMLLRPDLEAGLSQLFGRSGAHVAMQGLRVAGDWARATAWTATQNVAEYLAHERGDLVSRAEAEHFLRGVEQLREQVDRLDARLSHLEGHTKN